jgi:hypothetical protein
MLGANREEAVYASIALHGRESPMRAVYDVTIQLSSIKLPQDQHQERKIGNAESNSAL